jgi:hypothetical protein
MVNDAEYHTRIRDDLVRKALAKCGLDRLTRAAAAASAGDLDLDGRRILEACRRFIFDCLEPPSSNLSQLTGMPPSGIAFELPDLRKSPPASKSLLRLWLDYQEELKRTRTVMRRLRSARSAANRKLTITEQFPELSGERRFPSTAGDLACLLVARKHNLELLTVKRKVASLPKNPLELRTLERLAFTGDEEVLRELRRRLCQAARLTLVAPSLF